MHDGKETASTISSNQAPSNDLSQRITMGAWHPKENTFAVAKHNSMFIYTEKRSMNSNDRKHRRQNDVPMRD